MKGIKGRQSNRVRNYSRARTAKHALHAVKTRTGVAVSEKPVKAQTMAPPPSDSQRS